MTRKDFLIWSALALLGWKPSELPAEGLEEAKAPEMPVLFLAHGSPMNIVEENSYTQMLRDLRARLPRPKAILVVSAHWNPVGSWVSADAQNVQLYDFFGFPDPLYEVRYTPPGSPDLAQRIAEAIPGVRPRSRKIDHGAWAPLHHLYPDADIPVLQLSIDSTLSASQHYALGRKLAFLRKEGMLIVGSGNVTHNLRMAAWDDAPTPQWAADFDAYVAEAVAMGDAEALIHYERAGEAARTAHPTDEHYLPLLYAAAAAGTSQAEVIHEGFQNASISMRSWRFG